MPKISIPVERLLGRPFQWGADGPDVFDCYGLARHVLREFYGHELPDVPRAAGTHKALARAVLRHPARASWRDTPRPCDGAFCTLANVNGNAMHVGVFVIEGRSRFMLHAEQRLGVVADDLVTLGLKGYHSLVFYQFAGAAA